MRKPLICLCLLGATVLGATVAPNSVARADTPVVAPAAKTKVVRGRMILLLSPTTANGVAVKPKHPIFFLGSAFRNSAGGFVLSGKGAPHLTGNVSSANTFRASDPKGLLLEGKVSFNSTVAAASGKFSMTAGKTTLAGTFALVPISSAGGALIGGGPGVNGLPNGWGGKGSSQLGGGLDGWGYQGGGLFDGPERANLGGTTVGGSASSAGGDMWDAFWGWVSGSSANGGKTPTQADGSQSTGNAAHDGATAIDQMNKGQYGGTGSVGADDDTRKVLAGDNNQSQDERQTYGTGALNSNLVLKGQDGQGTGFEFGASGGAEQFRGVPAKGDNPFEVSAADKLNVAKLINGASDPSPGH